MDFNKRAKLYLKPEKHAINNFYGLNFSTNTLNGEELIAEKVCALINRNKPRDYFDVYQIIKKGIPINIKLVQEKSKAHNEEFNIIKIFNKTNKVYSNWEKDLIALTPNLMPFEEVIQTFKKYFKYSEEKEKHKEKHKND